ncbi:hypothetical protein [Streptomyces kaempferi]
MTNNPTPETVAADRVALRDRIIAIIEHLRDTGAVYALEPGEGGRIADAVLAEIPETARLHDQILTLQADLAKLRDLLRTENERANAAIDRETTAEEAEEEQRLAVSEALGLGTSAPWDAIRERAAELAAPADPAAEWRAAADRLEAHAASVADVSDDPIILVAKARAHDAAVWREAAALLRRLAVAPVSGPGGVAGETQQDETQAADRVVAHVPTTGTDLHCLRCEPLPLGDIWTAVTAEELEDGGICTQCGTDVLIPQPETQATPCSQPNHCDDDELCAVHEEEQAHAEGEHAFCGPTCEVEFPSDMLRNTILHRAVPGSAGMLDELLRRAAVSQPVTEA